MTTSSDTAAIVAVGSELLTPSRADTNSLLITDLLNSCGIEVVAKLVVGDDKTHVADALRLALDRARLVVCCGGLGPTEDDVTRDALADVLQQPLHEEAAVVLAIEARFRARRLEMPDINRRQARMPTGAQVLSNAVGTAPGLAAEVDGRQLYLLPGPPRELEPMLREALANRGPRSGRHTIRRRIMGVVGRTESHTEDAIRDLYERWAHGRVPVQATILASLGRVELHLRARAFRSEDADRALAEAAEAVVGRLGSDVYSSDGRPLEEVVGGLLLEREWRIGVAESCTGGLITSRLTDVPGSSGYVDHAIVSYSNEAKMALLGVSPGDLEAHGAVSDVIARAMALGVRRVNGVEVGLAVTGIAGPAGGGPDKPVGTVVIAVSTGERCVTSTRYFSGDREHVKQQASQAALDMVRRNLLV